MEIGELHGELRRVSDVPAAFAELVKVETRQAAKETFALALSGGGTARQCYEALSVTPGIDWEKVVCLLGDERCVGADDDDANQKMIRQSLLDKVTPAAFHPMDCNRREAYERLLEGLMPLDLVHLGLGPDGHTASLFPASPGLTSPPGELVVENIDPEGRNKHPRLSLTFEAIDNSRLVVFTVSGQEKADALARIAAGEDLPAGRVRAGEVIWLCDEAAMSRLSR